MLHNVDPVFQTHVPTYLSTFYILDSRPEDSFLNQCTLGIGTRYLYNYKSCHYCLSQCLPSNPFIIIIMIQVYLI